MSGIRIFSLAGVPVSVSPFYLLLLAYYAWSIGNVPEAIIWIVTVTMGLLVHEFGHALVARHYKLAPQIILHGFGGLCAHERSKKDLHDVFIITAGPGLGVAFAILVYALEKILMAVAPELFVQQPLLLTFFNYTFWVSFIWNFVNLIPLWPLDGGQLFRLGAVRLLGPVRGEKVTHYLGAGIAVICAFLGLQLGSVLLILLCLLLAWQNISQIRSGGASGPIRRRNRFADELYKKAIQAMKENDWREAARLCHQLRAEGNVPDDVLDKVWEVLAISTTNMGEYKDALSYIKRAPRSPSITEAQIRCHIGLKDYAKATELLELPEGQKLSPKTRENLAAHIERERPL